MINFCTLFDSNYLSRGLAMYESLKNHCDNFHLYIFPFDNKCADVLNTLNLDYVTIITQDEFEDEELLKIKPFRSHAEYCWTCTPSIIRYLFNKYSLSVCTYLDADIYFFSDPQILINELGNSSVIITEHRYTPRYDNTETNGIYNVQFITFKNNKQGLVVLNWWRDACLDSCELNPAEGKCGDQKYLDDWTTRFKEIHVLEYLGGGVAPWNVQQYSFKERDNKIIGQTKLDSKVFNLVFYHFQAVKFWGNKIDFNNYLLGNRVINIIYKPYIKALIKAADLIREVDSQIDPHGIRKYYIEWWFPLYYLKNKITNTYNIV